MQEGIEPYAERAPERPGERRFHAVAIRNQSLIPIIEHMCSNVKRF